MIWLLFYKIAKNIRFYNYPILLIFPFCRTKYSEGLQKQSVRIILKAFVDNLFSIVQFFRSFLLPLIFRFLLRSPFFVLLFYLIYFNFLFFKKLSWRIFFKFIYFTYFCKIIFYNAIVIWTKLLNSNLYFHPSVIKKSNI